MDTDGAKSGLTLPFISNYASAIHKHTNTHILKPFEDSEPTGLKVDTVWLMWLCCAEVTRRLGKQKAAKDQRQQGEVAGTGARSGVLRWPGRINTVLSLLSRIREGENGRLWNDQKKKLSFDLDCVLVSCADFVMCTFSLVIQMFCSEGIIAIWFFYFFLWGQDKAFKLRILP